MGRMKTLQHVDLVRGCEKRGGSIEVEVLSNGTYPVARFEPGAKKYRINPETDYTRTLLSSLVGKGLQKVVATGGGTEAMLELLERDENELTATEQSMNTSPRARRPGW